MGQESGLRADDFTTNGVELIRHKLSRLASNNWDHRDSWIDIAGYAFLIAACQDRKRETDSRQSSLSFVHPIDSTFARNLTREQV